ncbi:acyl-CoA dehydrogenase family protein [Sphingomonas sp.]|jgi:alkylation response protein AidB-like acyl-CoA dehydrogenase|uniref:acyl-CoA dehydrogenase family protein n=1 Tax=Sphingomonas sp. TaxID=28214 RepID=UPI002E2EF09B|nr:acyl-CoA dehydrogenase family protein [Sphingomonas sp.]HEX4694764.1 acyl-CoA dehydrogenase family protein [Sphingomonas sp.]
MAVLSEEQTMLRDMAREWTSNESPVIAWRKVRDADSPTGFDPAAYREMAQMGWAGIVIPESYGGSDFGWLSLGLVVEELGKTLTASPLAASAAAASAIVLGGSDAQKEQWLPRIASGELVATLAVDEGPRHDPADLKTSMSGGKLSGTKAFVAEGDAAGLFVVAAADGLYLVDGEAAGASRSRRKLTDFRSHAEVRFDGVDADKLSGGGDALLDQVLDRARVLAAAEMLGMAGQGFETTLAYLKQRVQFGQVLATFQALQHRMANLFSDIELMRSAVENGLSAIDRGGDTRQAALLAKTKANEVGHLMSREMIQLHGGIGMTDEYDAGFYLKRMRVLEAMWGNTAYLRNRFATLNGY